MKPDRYTVLVIPDNGDENKQFTISRRKLVLSIFILIVILVGLIGVGVYSLPKARQFDEIQTKYDGMVKERMEIMALMQDLQRMKQMDQLIRKTLGTELKFTPDEGLTDTSAAVSSAEYSGEEEFHISYVENIPSLAPVKGYVTQRMDKASIYHQKNHYGIDIAAKKGDPVLAASSGYVVYAGWTYDLGNIVIIYHGDGYFTHYGHNQQNLVEQHNFVKRGDVIALVGNTGISSGPHLHFEVWHGGKAIDPMEFFPEYKTVDLSPGNNE